VRPVSPRRWTFDLHAPALKDRPSSADRGQTAAHKGIPDKGTPVVRRVRKATGLPNGVGRVTEGVVGATPGPTGGDSMAFKCRNGRKW
jgi:hypothetical protein